MSSSSRPVPRRESPWGVTGENHPEPKAHRCNDRVEDVIQVNWIFFLWLIFVNWIMLVPYYGIESIKESTKF